MPNKTTAALAQLAKEFFERAHGDLERIDVVPYREDVYKVEFWTVADDGSYVGFLTEADIRELSAVPPPPGETYGNNGGPS